MVCKPNDYYMWKWPEKLIIALMRYRALNEYWTHYSNYSLHLAQDLLYEAPSKAQTHYSLYFYLIYMSFIIILCEGHQLVTNIENWQKVKKV